MLFAKLRIWRGGISCSCLAAGLAIGSLSSACYAADAVKNSSAGVEQLVTDALHAEIDGNVAKRRVLLSMAVDANPEYSPARWQSGQQERLRGRSGIPLARFAYLGTEQQRGAAGAGRTLVCRSADDQGRNCRR